MVLRSISHLSEYRTFHETFLLLVGDQSFSSNEPMGLYATPILQYNKNTRKAYPIISVALRGRKSRLIGIFFRCSSRKKINKYNQFWSKLLKKECFRSFQSISSYTNTAFIQHVFLFGTGLLRLDMRIIFHHFAEKTSVKRLEWQVFGYPLAM